MLRFALILALTLVLPGTGFAAPSSAPKRPDRVDPLPKRVQGIDVKEKLEAQIPLGLHFTNQDGQSLTLREYFAGDRPVIVTLNYTDCPMLCSLMLNGVTKALKQLDWTAGGEFRIVTLSINPKDTPSKLKSMQMRYLNKYGRPEAKQGWHFLHGSQKNVEAVANAMGMSYGYNEKRDEWVHPAAFIVATPDGRVARYLYGLEYHPKTLRLSLVEASQGKVGSAMDRLILYCFHYDASEGRYAPVARNIMRLGGGLAVLLLGGFLSLLWFRESQKRRLRLQDCQT